MNHLQDEELLRVSSWSVSRSSSTSLLEGARVLALYFSAHWCPPCRQFTPRLAVAYRGRRDERAVRVLFVSSDRSQNEMLDYMRQMHADWPAIPLNNPLSETLKRVYGVRGIPALIVVNASDGSVISAEGRQDILSQGAGAFDNWLALAANPTDVSLVSLLAENPTEVMSEAASILLKIISNVLKDPQNLKYRSVRLSNPVIEGKLLCAHGAFEILFSIGFEEGDDSLVLPLSANLAVLEDFKSAIQGIAKSKNNKSSVANGNRSNNNDHYRGDRNDQSSSMAQSVAISAGASSRPQIPQVLKSKTGEMEILSKLELERQLALSYEDQRAQAQARDVVPLAKLQERAQSNLIALQRQEETVGPERLPDLLLLELLKWFREDFFSWMDSPLCPDCQVAGVYVNTVHSNSEESADGAAQTEIHACPSCPRVSRFPRYHSKPAKLLRTRVGRCGEFANCFALILRSLHFDVRRILDLTDHVWVEVYSTAEKRWIHADPCEAICDRPLLYERGWGKRLSYVIAASKDEIQDVSWRYSADHETMRERRKLVDENWLNSQLLRLTELNMKGMSESEREKIIKRRLLELVELMSTKSEDEMKKAEGLQGRQSGSLAWRMARGEIGPNVVFQPFTWTLTDKEVEEKEFCVEYDIVKDIYQRPSNETEVVAGWQKGAKVCENVMRKFESDWGFFYIARTEGSTDSTLGWELDLSGSPLSVKSIELLVKSQVFESGRVVWQLYGNSICLLPSSGKVLQSEALAGAKKILLTASMSGGQGDAAWQHTQIFRTHKTDKEGCQLRIRVTLQDE